MDQMRSSNQHDDQGSDAGSDGSWDFDDEILATGVAGAERVYSVNETSTGLYKQDLGATLKLWINYRNFMKLPVDPENPFAEPPSQGNIHSWLLWLLKTKKGHFGKRLAVTTLVRYLFMFKTLYRERTGKKIDGDVITQLRKAVRNLFVARGASLASKRRSLANRPVVLDLLHFLWAYDDQTFTNPRLRLQLSVQIMLLFYLGGRPGEIIESTCHRGTNEGLLYKDLTFIVVKRESRKRLILLIKIRNQKFRRNVSRAFIDLPLIQDCMTPELCPVTQLLALAIADGALCGIRTAQDLNLKVDPANDCHAILRISEEAKQRPVLRFAAKNGDISPTRISTAGWLQTQLGSLSKRAGYEAKLVPYDLRRGHANVLNEHVSAAVRRQRMGHKSDDTFLHYISSVSAVDTQAMLHGREAENYLLDFVKSAALRKTITHAGSKDNVPRPDSSKMDDIFPLRNTYLEASAAHQSAADYYSSTEAKRDTSRRFRAQLRHDPARSELINLFYFRSEGEEVELPRLLDPLCAMAGPDRTDRHYPDVPEPKNGRCSVCNHAPATSSISSMLQFELHMLGCTMKAAQRKDEMILQRIVKKQNQVCTWKQCHFSFGDQSLPEIARHISRHTRTHSGTKLCHYGNCNGLVFDHITALKQHMIADHCAPHPDTLPSRYYCFECRLHIQCFLDWRMHCADHLRILDFSCAPASEMNVVVMPGLCPFCLGDVARHPEKRYIQFRTIHELRTHIHHRHLDNATWPLCCPHPLCDDHLMSPEDFCRHTKQLHDITALSERCEDRSPDKTSEILNCPISRDTASGAEVPERRPIQLPANPTIPLLDSCTLLPQKELDRQQHSTSGAAQHKQPNQQMAQPAEISGCSESEQESAEALSPVTAIAREVVHGKEGVGDILAIDESTADPLFVQPPDYPVVQSCLPVAGLSTASGSKRPADQDSVASKKVKLSIDGVSNGIVAPRTELGEGSPPSTTRLSLPHEECPRPEKANQILPIPDSDHADVFQHIPSLTNAESTRFEPIARGIGASIDMVNLYGEVIERLKHLRSLWGAGAPNISPELDELAWTTVLTAEDLLYHFYEGEDLGIDSSEALERDVAWLLGLLAGRSFSADDIANLAPDRNLPIKSAYLTHPEEAERREKRRAEEVADCKQRTKAARQEARNRRIKRPE